MCGGLLADGMGLGKTLAMVACIVASLHMSGSPGNKSLNDQELKPSLTPVTSTLVIVPADRQYCIPTV